jgi:hypothetical protein
MFPFDCRSYTLAKVSAVLETTRRFCDRVGHLWFEGDGRAAFIFAKVRSDLPAINRIGYSPGLVRRTAGSVTTPLRFAVAFPMENQDLLTRIWAVTTVLGRTSGTRKRVHRFSTTSLVGAAAIDELAGTEVTIRVPETRAPAGT